MKSISVRKRHLTNLAQKENRKSTKGEVGSATSGRRRRRHLKLPGAEVDLKALREGK